MAYSVAMMKLVDANQLTEERFHQNTIVQMNDIKAALIRHAELYGRYPCPASLTLTPSDTDHGAESTAANACNNSNDTDNAIGTHGVNDVATTHASHFLTIGAVPFKTLNLQEDMMYDRWKNRIVYAVLDAEVASSPSAIDDTDANEKFFDVFTSATGTTSTFTDTDFPQNRFVFVLVSIGENGKGAYTRAGTVNGTCNTSAPEGENCDFTDNDFRLIPAIDTEATVEDDYYDDIVVYHLD